MNKYLHFLQHSISVSYLHFCAGSFLSIFLLKIFVLPLTGGVMFWMLFLDLAAFILVIVALIGSLVFAALYYKKERLKALYPLIVSAVACVLVYLVPFNIVTTNIDFYLHLNDREKLVGKIQMNENIESSDVYKKILTRGDIIRGEDGSISVFFPVFIGILDNFSGFIYRSDTLRPERNDFGCDYFEIEKMREHWFWVACH